MKPTAASGMWIVALAVALSFASCGGKAAEDSSAELPAATVRASIVEQVEFSSSEDIPGTVRPKVRASIEAKVSGKIHRLPVHEGQIVKAGQLLAELDVQEIRAKFDQALAAQEQAQRDLKRISSLARQRAAAQSELDAVEARARIAQGAVDEAETMLSYARIAAPFDGVITRKLAEIGDLAIPGRPLLEMEDPSSLRFETNLPETFFDTLKMGEQHSVRIAALAEPITGVVAELSPVIDPLSRTFLAKLDLPTVPGLRSGQFGYVAVPVSSQNIIKLPATAVIKRGQLELVFVEQNGRAKMRLVRTGRRFGSELEILSGLEAGENLITQGAQDLRDGQRVEVAQ